MPEASVHKYRYPFFPKNKIRFPENILASFPSCNFVLSKYFNQTKFGSFVSAGANAGHDIRTFFFCPNIHE